MVLCRRAILATAVLMSLLVSFTLGFSLYEANGRDVDWSWTRGKYSRVNRNNDNSWNWRVSRQNAFYNYESGSTYYGDLLSTSEEVYAIAKDPVVNGRYWFGMTSGIGWIDSINATTGTAVQFIDWDEDSNHEGRMRFTGFGFDLHRSRGLACSLFGENIISWDLNTDLDDQNPRLVYERGNSNSQKFTSFWYKDEQSGNREGVIYLSTATYSSETEAGFDMYTGTGGGTLARAQVDYWDIDESGPNNGGVNSAISLSYPSTGINGFSTYAITNDASYVYASGNLGRVIRWQLSTQSSPSGFTVYPVGIPNALYSTMISTADGRIVVGASGLYCEINMSTRTIVRLFFLENFPQITASALDLSHNVLFFGTTGISHPGGYVYRVNLVDFFPMGESVGPIGENINAILFQTDNNRPFLIASPRISNATRYHINVAECENYDCPACLGDDPNYCTLCSTSYTCTLDTSCAGAKYRTGNYTCPGVSELVPSSGSRDGGTLISVNGFGFTTGLYCRFDTTVVPATFIDSTQLQCTSPSRVSVTVDEVAQVDIVRNVSGVIQLFVPGSTFTYYDCGQAATATCGADSCFSRSECRWCLSSARCVNGNTCLGRKGTSCPFISDYSPKAIVFENSVAPSTRQVTFYLSTATQTNFTCSWNGTFLTNGTYNAGTTSVVCLAPSFPASGNVDVTLKVNSDVYAAPVTMEFYDCHATASCQQCLTETRQLGCSWCTSSLSCIYPSDDEGVCATAERTESCPGITDFTPKRWNIDNLSYPTINLTVSSYADRTFMCRYFFSNGTVGDFGATYYSVSSLSCNYPVGAPSGNTDFQVYSDGVPYSEVKTLLLYTCTEQPECYNCVDFFDCKWCNLGGSSGCLLSSSGACAAAIITANASCPFIDLYTPSRVLVATTTEVIIEGDTFGLAVNEPSLFCDWGAGYPQTPALNHSSTSVTCETPFVTTPELITAKIVRDSHPFGGEFKFDFYNCSRFSSNCSSCVSPDYSCGWCLDRCSSLSECPSALSVCPSLLAASPSSVVREGVEQVTVVGGPFQPVTYQCRFGAAVTSGVYINDTAIFCETPVVPPFSAGTYSLASTLAILFNGVPYSENTLPFSFYDCAQPALAACGPQCFAPLPQCGWCVSGGVGSGECSGKALCADLWVSDSCLAIDTISPDHTVPAGNETITISLDRALADVDNNDTLECSFGGVSVPAWYQPSASDPSVAEFLCSAPSQPARKRLVAADVAIYRNGYSIVSSSGGFTYVDCTLVPESDELALETIDREPRSTVCTRCIILPFCGFCAATGDCQVQNWCADRTQWFKSASIDTSCPLVDDVRPQTGALEGGDTVTITGARFVNSTNLFVAFATLNSEGFVAYANATFVSDAEITVVTPPGQAEGDVQVFLVYDNTFYSKESDGFSYLPRPEATLEGGAIAGIVVGAAAVAGGLFALLFVLRRKQLGVFSIELKEPDYFEIAFGADRVAQYKLPDDNYGMLATCLMEKDRTFLFTFSRSVQPTEHDKVSKSYVEITHRHDRAKEFIIAFISEEVYREKSENTIFRSNSVTSKMFKFYAKLIGTRFLWSKTARIIVELNTIAAQKRKALDSVGKSHSSAAGGQSLFTMEMEVDPTKITDGGDTSGDDEANVFQLLLTCQKVWGELMRSLKDMPGEFREIFASCQFAIISRFQSQEAVFKSVGGFLFLRFICPALTAPHAYGLLDQPPNEICQRQLVLIGKVLQNLANMTMPGAKEEFMQKLDTFFVKNIPKMEQFYKDILIPPPIGYVTPNLPVLPANVDDTVYGNALSNIWSVIFQSKKVTAQIDKEHTDNPEVHAKLHNLLKELHEKYPKAPKKIEDESKKKKSKGRDPSKKRILGPRDDD